MFIIVTYTLYYLLIRSFIIRRVSIKSQISDLQYIALKVGAKINYT
jgi:hypothetical protein